MTVARRIAQSICQCKYEHGSSLSEHALGLRLNKQQCTGIQGRTTLKHRPNAGNMEAHNIMSRNIYSLQHYQEMCELIGPFDYIRDVTISFKGIRHGYP